MVKEAKYVRRKTDRLVDWCVGPGGGSVLPDVLQIAWVKQAEPSLLFNPLFMRVRATLPPGRTC